MPDAFDGFGEGLDSLAAMGTIADERGHSAVTASLVAEEQATSA
jgi:hypothetical protein